MPIYEEIFAEETCELVPGGSALNSARSAQHILKGSGKHVAYLGCIGKDAFGDKLTKCLDDQGVVNKLAKSDDTATGTCAVTVKDKERALCANIGASAKFPMEHLEANMVRKIVDFFFNTPFLYFFCKLVSLTVYLICLGIIEKCFIRLHNWVLHYLKLRCFNHGWRILR